MPAMFTGRAAKTQSLRSVYIVDGARTPFLKNNGVPGPFAAADLAVLAGRDVLLRQPFQPTELDEVIMGCVMPSPNEVNIARVISLRLGCGKQVPAWTVQRNCASGLQALDNAAQDIMQGRANLVLAGGAEAMSRAPLLWNLSFLQWFGEWRMSKTFSQRMRLLTQLRPSHFKPIIGLLQGLTDPVVGLSMGQTAENLAYQFHISRQMMDEFSLMSHQRLAGAIDQQQLKEVISLYEATGKILAQDDGLRRDGSIEKLAKLKPFFDKIFGKVTAANSSQITDGAALLLLASAEAVKTHRLPVLARIVDTHWAGVAPEQMGLGPVHASANLLAAQKLRLSDIDYWEINEAFAAQVLACLAAFKDQDYCQTQLQMPELTGVIPIDRLNVDGGAISIGHPVGASGARLILRLAHILKRQKAKRGIATLCIGGGQGGAMLIENVDEVAE